MDYLDFSALLRKNEKKHKIKPPQFASVAGGVQKRLDANIKNRKSTRLTTHDSVRNLPKCESPQPVDHRRQQLEKWKAEKEQKKKEQAAQKKKPFLAGLAKNPLTFVPPPPVPKTSTSARVTRSQTRNTKITKPNVKSPVKSSKLAMRNTESFAPKDAGFKPPQIKNLVKLPKLAPLSKSKNKVPVITFDPVVPNVSNTTKQTRSRSAVTRQNATETIDPVVPNVSNTTKQTRSRPILTRQNVIETMLSTTDKKLQTRSITRGKITKKPSPRKLAKKPLQSSSSGSDFEQLKPTCRIQTSGPSRSLKKVKNLPSKDPPIVATSSSDKSGEESAKETARRKSARKSITCIQDSQSSSEKMSSDTEPPSVKEVTIIKNNKRKSLSKNFSPTSLSSSSNNDKASSDSENFGKSPVVVLRRSFLCTPKNKIPKSESSSEERLRSPKSVDVPLTPEQMEAAMNSPCVTLSRGKDNARKEMKWKIAEGLFEEDTRDSDSVDHFRQQLSSEIKRMTEMCDTWDKISEQTVLPEAIQEEVLSAVGQARLLMSQKLQQFASLVERCARPDPATAIVTPADLQGFWDMVFMQVENVDVRFKKLEELRARNWNEEKPVVQLKKTTAKPKVKKTVKASGPSRIREIIAAARKAKKEQAGGLLTEGSSSASEGEKSFEGGFFCVRSPVKSLSSSPSTPTPSRKQALLKAVLSNEAKKASASKNSSSLAMLRASFIGKNVEYDGIACLPQTPQTPLNLFATPGRSILKSTNKSTKKSGKKSIKMVLFDDSDSDSQYLSFARESDVVTANNNELAKPLPDSTGATPVQGKENSPVLVSKVLTRSHRRSLQDLSNIEDTSVTEKKTPRRSYRKKKNAEESTDVEKTTPNKQLSGKKADQSMENIVEKPRKRSSRRSEVELLEESIVEPQNTSLRRSSRRKKAIAV